MPTRDAARSRDCGTDTQDVTVTDLGEGRHRMIGMIVGPPELGRHAVFTYEVVSEAGNKLRGFRASHLEVSLVAGPRVPMR